MDVYISQSTSRASTRSSGHTSFTGCRTGTNYSSTYTNAHRTDTSTNYSST